MEGIITPEREETPVDDVRRIRERLHRDAGDNIHKLIEDSKTVAEQYREKLRLKVVQPPTRQKTRSRTRKVVTLL